MVGQGQRRRAAHGGGGPYLEPVAPSDFVAELARRSPASVFATAGWLGPWLEHLAEDAQLLRARDGALVGLARRRGGLRLLGDGLSDELGPVAADPEAARALGAHVRGLGEPLLARDLPGDRPWAAWLGGRVVRAEPSLVVEAPDHEGWLADRSRAFRRTARTTARRLEAAGAVVRDEPSLDVLVHLHRLRFGARSTVFDGANGAFLRDAFAELRRAGRAHLRVLDLGGEPVGALLLLRHHGRDAFYQSGWDPRAAALRPGVALLLDAVRRAPRGELALLRGDEAYKREWATADRPVVTVAL